MEYVVGCCHFWFKLPRKTTQILKHPFKKNQKPLLTPKSAPSPRNCINCEDVPPRPIWLGTKGSALRPRHPCAKPVHLIFIFIPRNKLNFVLLNTRYIDHVFAKGDGPGWGEVLMNCQGSITPTQRPLPTPLPKPSTLRASPACILPPLAIFEAIPYFVSRWLRSWPWRK